MSKPTRYLTLALLALSATAIRPAAATEEAEIATESRLARIMLPAETIRMNDEATINKLIAPLNEVGKQFKNSVGQREVLAWADPAKRASKVKAELLQNLKTAGYEISEIGDAIKTEAGPLRFFAARKDQPRTVLLAYWVDNKDALILTWALMNKGEAAVEPAPTSANPTALQGSWGFTTISGTTYWDRSTGAYLGSGTGGSQTYTFLPNGRYKMFNYIKSRVYSWETQGLTWEEGTVTFTGNKVTFTPSSGKYQIIDNQVASKNYTRPMTDAEIKKNVKETYWRLDTQNGKRVLIMSKEPETAGVTYKQVEN